MKRKDLERRLRRAGCFLEREGASHSLWWNPNTGGIDAMPGLAEIKEPLARKILARLGAS